MGVQQSIAVPKGRDAGLRLSPPRRGGRQGLGPRRPRDREDGRARRLRRSCREVVPPHPMPDPATDAGSMSAHVSARGAGVPLRLDSARRRAGAVDHRRRRHVVGGRGAAGGAGGVRRRARRRLPALHADDDRLRLRRHPDGPPRRPLRHHGPGRSSAPSRSASAMSLAGLATEPLAVRPGAGPADRASAARPRSAPLIADISLWFTRRRGIAVGDLRQRQLPRRHGLAAGRAALHREPSAGARRYVGIGVVLPRRPCCRWRSLLRRRAAAHRGRGADASAARHVAAARAVAGRAAGAAGRRRRRLLRRDVDAAGPHRRLLRRPRLRRGARRRDALADAGLRHRQPPGLGLDLRPHRRRCARCCSARCCRALALLLFLPFDGLVVALRRVGAVRPVPGRHRAVLRRSSCASTSRPRRPARASAS